MVTYKKFKIEFFIKTGILQNITPRGVDILFNKEVKIENSDEVYVYN